MSDINIQEDKTMVPLDVISLFTAIPVNNACHYIRKKLIEDHSLHLRTKLDIDDIIVSKLCAVKQLLYLQRHCL